MVPVLWSRILHRCLKLIGPERFVYKKSVADRQTLILSTEDGEVRSKKQVKDENNNNNNDNNNNAK